MAELTDFQDMQPKHHRPSKLRNEVHRDSTDDERVPDQSYVQVPDSDIIVPETQSRYDGDGPVAASPRTEALLAKNAVSKSQIVGESIPFAYGLSKPTFQRDREASPQFTFAHARLAVPKAAAKEVTHSKPIPEPAAVDVTLQHVLEVSTNAVLNDQCQQKVKSPRTKKHTKRNGQNSKGFLKSDTAQKEPKIVSQAAEDFPGAELEVTKPTLPEPYRTESPRHESPRSKPSQPEQFFAVGAAQLDADPIMPLSAHAGPKATVCGKRDHSGTKKGKKFRKPQLTHHRDGPWPARGQQERRSVVAAELSSNDQPVLDVIPHAAVEHRGLENQDKHINLDTEEWDEQPANTQGDVSTDHEQHISRSAEEQAIASQTSIPLDQRDCLNPTSREQVFSPVDSQHPVTVNHVQQIIRTPEEHPALSTDMPDAVYDTDGPDHNISKKPHEHKDIEITPPAWPVGYAENRPVDEPLHRVSSRAGPNRVNKPQKKKRNAAALRPVAAMPAIGKRDGFPQAFDHILDGLRMVVSKTYSDSTSEINARKSSIEALQQVIDLQKATIQALKNTDTTTRGTMVRQAETVERLKKYVKGLETDHVKIKANVKSYHDECDKFWKEKVGEVTAEKIELEQEFSTMIHAVNKSRQSMKTAMLECCHRLELSEHKRTTLIQNLKMQQVLLETEREKTTDLEQQISSSLQAMHSLLENNIGVMIEKLGSIQSSVEDTSADDKRGACLNECMEALKGLRATPFLTVKDTRKAEGMIRFLHETIDSKLRVLSRSVDAKEFPCKDVENCIRDQVQNLRTEILKYDEVSIECEKARQMNDHLTKQLQTKKEHHEHLDGQVKSLLHSEATLKFRSSQLETELNTIKKTSGDRDLESSDLKQEVVALRNQLRKAEKDLQAAVDKLRNVEDVREKEGSEAAGWKKSAEENMAKLTEVAKRVKQHKKDKESLQQEKNTLADMRVRMQEEYRKAIETKKAGWENDLHRVISEKEEKENALQEASHQLDHSQIQLQLVQQQLRSADSEISSLRKDKTAVESKFKKAQRLIDESSSATSELTALTGQLKEKDGAFEAKQQELNILRQEYVDLRGQATVLHESAERLELELSECKSTIESEREKASAQLSEYRTKQEAAFQEAQNQIAALKEEKQNVESSLELFRSNESSLKDTQSQTSYELERLRVELADMKNAKQAIEHESQRNQKAVDSELQSLKTQNQNEIGGLQRRLMQANVALKECEPKVKHVIYQKEQKLETHKRVSEQKIQQKLGLQEFLQVQSHQQSTINKGAPATPLHNTIAESSRRKVNRKTSSVADVKQLSHGQTPLPSGGVNSGKAIHSGAEPSIPFEPLDASMADDLGTRERLGQDGVSILEPVLEPVPETQVQDPTMTFKDFNQTMHQDSHNKDGSSSSISELRSDFFDGLSYTCASTPTSPQHKTRGRAPTDPSTKAAGYQTPRQPVENPMHDPQSCDRPKSRANTASRMKPLPSPSHRSQVEWDSQEPAFAAKPAQSQHSSSHRSNKTSNHVPSSPDYIHRTPSTAKMTYGHHAGKSTTFSSSRKDSVPRVLGQSSSQKRKGSANHAGSDTPAKKYRQSNYSFPSLSVPSSLPRDLERRAPGYPGGSKNSQGLRRTSPRTTVTGSISRPSRKKTNGRDHRYETRFAEEFRD